MKIFRVSVSGYETYIPEDFVHDKKTVKDFQKDLSNVIREAVNELAQKPIKTYITGYDLLKLIGPKLEGLGYQKTDLHEEDLQGECLYHDDDEKPKPIPSDVWSLIIEHNKGIMNRYGRR